MLKSFKFVFTLSAFLACVLFACKKSNSETAEPEQHKQLKPEDFAYIGKQHNQKLDAVYKALVSKLPSSEQRSNLTEATVREQAMEIAEETMVSDINLQTSWPAAIQISTTSFVTGTFDGVPLMENDKLYTQSFGNSLRPTVVNFLDRLDTVLMGADSNLTSINSKISVLETEVSLSSFTDYEQLIFYSASNVARYSSQYWVNNGDSWEQLAQSNTGGRNNIASRSFWGWVRAVVRGDVAGGAAAAAATYVANAIPGAGQTAYGGAIAVGATGGSVYNAIDYFF